MVTVIHVAQKAMILSVVVTISPFVLRTRDVKRRWISEFWDPRSFCFVLEMDIWHTAYCSVIAILKNTKPSHTSPRCSSCPPNPSPFKESLHISPHRITLLHLLPSSHLTTAHTLLMPDNSHALLMRNGIQPILQIMRDIAFLACPDHNPRRMGEEAVHFF
jgi:hypothetical protein